MIEDSREMVLIYVYSLLDSGSIVITLGKAHLVTIVKLAGLDWKNIEIGIDIGIEIKMGLKQHLVN